MYQFFVDNNPKSLKCACGRVDSIPIGLGRNAFQNQISQRFRRAYRLRPPALDYFPSDSAAKSLLTILINEVGQVLHADPL